MKWEDIYKVWKWEMCKFPVLSAQKYCLKTEISKPRFGPCYSFNWIEKEREKESIESDVAALTSGRMEIEQGGAKEQLERLPCYVLVKRKKSLLLFGFVHLCFL